MFSTSPAAGSPACTRAQIALNTLALDANLDWTLRLGPYVSAEGISAFEEQLRSKSAERAALSALALGLSRQSQALSTLRRAEPNRELFARAGWAIGLIALGDATASSTIARASAAENVELRRFVASGLAEIDTIRTIALLRPMLKDVDPSTKLRAATGLFKAKPKAAGKALSELADWPESEIHRDAARELAKAGRAGRALDVLPIHERARLEAQRAGKAASLVQLKASLKRTDSLEIPLSLGVALAAGHKAPALARVVGDRAATEMFVAKLFEGNVEALAGIATADSAGARHVAAMLFALSAAVPERATFEHAKDLRPILERWLVTQVVDDLEATWILRAFAKLAPQDAIGLAGARLLGPDTRALRTAMRVLARLGDDPSLVVNAADRSQDFQTKAVGYRAALKMCRK